MTRSILAIRPQPGLAATIEAGKAIGLPVRGLELARVEPCVWQAPDPSGYDGLLIGSANVFAHGGPQLESLRSLPVLAVGSRTSDAARGSGFEVELTGAGGLQEIIDRLDGHKRKLLRLAGQDKVALCVPSHIQIDTRTVYAVEHLPIDIAALPEPESRPIVMLYSARSAHHWRAECERSDVRLSDFTIVALGPRIAKAAGSGWADVQSSARPDEASLLALAKSLWQM